MRRRTWYKRGRYDQLVKRSSGSYCHRKAMAKMHAIWHNDPDRF